MTADWDHGIFSSFFLPLARLFFLFLFLPVHLGLWFGKYIFVQVAEGAEEAVSTVRAARAAQLGITWGLAIGIVWQYLLIAVGKASTSWPGDTSSRFLPIFSAAASPATPGEDEEQDAAANASRACISSVEIQRDADEEEIWTPLAEPCRSSGGWA